MSNKNLATIAQNIRRNILKMTTKAKAGHATSSLSAVEIMVSLLFDQNFVHPNYQELKDLNATDLNQKLNQNWSDRFIFSKGHASPLFFGIYRELGVLIEVELDTFRDFDGILEGHSTPRFTWTEATTGSLGQGLGIGAGLAMALRMKNGKNTLKNNLVNSLVNNSDKDLKFSESNKNPEIIQEIKQEIPELENKENQVLNLALNPNLNESWQNSEKVKNGNRIPNVFVLLGDSEMAEGSAWEALNLASFYHLDSLIGIIDLNRLGQTGETQIGWESQNLAQKVASFGWEVWQVDGHNLADLSRVYQEILQSQNSQNTNLQTEKIGKPKMIIAKTVKGKGVDFLENAQKWHGKALNEEEFAKALSQL